MSDELAKVIERRDYFYLERHRLCATLIREWQRIGYPAFLAGPEPADPPWRFCVYVETPEGQLSWHVPEKFLALYGELPPFAGQWDGHTTEEKYARIDRLKTR